MIDLLIVIAGLLVGTFFLAVIAAMFSAIAAVDGRRISFGWAIHIDGTKQTSTGHARKTLMPVPQMPTRKTDK